jgi:hypothetical protein
VGGLTDVNTNDLFVLDYEGRKFGRVVRSPEKRDYSIGQCWAFTWRVLWGIPWVGLGVACCLSVIGLLLAPLFFWIGCKPLINHEKRIIAAKVQRILEEEAKNENVTNGQRRVGR